MKVHVVVAVVALACAVQAQQVTPRNDSIRKEELRADLFFLAGDGMRGRLTATPENLLAAEVGKSRFERLGLKPPGPGGSYYQSYNLVATTLGSSNDLETFSADGITGRPALGQDFYPQRFSASASARGPVVFAGFGIARPERSHDDYRGDQIKGRIALVLAHEPGERDPESPFDGVVTSEPSVAWRKALAAQQKGAIGVLFVDDVHNHQALSPFDATFRATWPEVQPRIRNLTLATWVEQIRIPAAQISPVLAATILAGTGRTLDDLARAAETPGGMAPAPVPGVEIRMGLAVNRHVIPDRNVLALLEGSDPALRNEWVIVSAHIDHNGGDGNQIFNGADDDGSGTVALLEIAEAYALAAREGRRPRRSVLFAAWNSEERGLLGAWAYTERPLAPLAATVAVLNMDMVGRNEEVPVGGGARFQGLDVQTAESNSNAVNLIGYTFSPALTAEVEKANTSYALMLRKRYDNNSSNLLRRSDQWPFLQRGVPAIWFHTGLHPDYHTVYDRPEKVNYDKMERIARLVHEVSWTLANQETRPRLVR